MRIGENQIDTCPNVQEISIRSYKSRRPHFRHNYLRNSSHVTRPRRGIDIPWISGNRSEFIRRNLREYTIDRLRERKLYSVMHVIN